MPITKERLAKILEELIIDESEAVERYEILSNQIAFDEKLPKYLRQDLSMELLEMAAEEQTHRDAFERYLEKLKGLM